MTSGMPGSVFLIALAVLAIGFAAYSAIVLSYRKTAAGAVSAFHNLLFRYVIECCLLVSTFALLPVLLALSPLSPPLLLRISCGLFAFVILVYALTYIFIRRPRLMPGRLPLRFYTLGAITIVVDLVLWLQAFGLAFNASVWTYTLANLWVLVQAGIVFSLTLDTSLQRGAIAKGIELAFSEWPYPGDENVLRDTACNHLACNEIRARIVGKRWNNLEVGEVPFTADWVMHMTPAGYRYYLPGLMKISLQKPDDSALPAHIADALTPPTLNPPGPQAWMQDYRHPFGRQQQEIIRDFLLWVSARFEGGDESEAAAVALRALWSTPDRNRASA